MGWVGYLLGPTLRAPDDANKSHDIHLLIIVVCGFRWKSLRHVEIWTHRETSYLSISGNQQTVSFYFHSHRTGLIWPRYGVSDVSQNVVPSKGTSTVYTPPLSRNKLSGNKLCAFSVIFWPNIHQKKTKNGKKMHTLTFYTQNLKKLWSEPRFWRPKQVVQFGGLGER